MATCIICDQDAGFLSECCNTCKEKLSRQRESKPVRWDAILRIATISILGLLPSILISIVALLSFLTATDLFSKGRFVVGLFVVTMSCMSIFGTFTLIQHLSGKPLHEVRTGMLAGLVTMIAMVVQIPVRVYLDSLGVPGMLPKENLALAAGALNGVISIIPLTVFSYLVYHSWKPERTIKELDGAI